MGQQQSKDELLYQRASDGNIEGIKALQRDGAGLEWVDKEGKTPLIVALTKPDCLLLAKTLVELGANVNYYCPGRHAGTPLHYAARRGHELTVKLLLSHGASALIMNDACHTPLDVAREKGHIGVVRAFESHICLFSGWLRELLARSFLEAFIPSRWASAASRKVWAVIVPRHSCNPRQPQIFELAIYPAVEVAQPRTVIQLWKANIEEVNFNQSDPTLVIFDKVNNTHFKFLSENDGDKQQLQQCYNACRGLCQSNIPHPAIPATAPTSIPEDAKLAMASNPKTFPLQYLQLQFLRRSQTMVAQLQRFYNACRGLRQSNIPHPAIPATVPTSIPEDARLAMASNPKTFPLQYLQLQFPMVAQLQRFYNACRGLRQSNIPHPAIPATASTSIPEDVQLAMAINASLQTLAMAINTSPQTATEEQLPVFPTKPVSQMSSTNGCPPSGPSYPPPKIADNGCLDEPASSSTYNGWGGLEAGCSGQPIQQQNDSLSKPAVDPASSQNIPPPVPSAPPIPEEFPDNGGPTHYPPIDDSSIDLSMPTVEKKLVSTVAAVNRNVSGSCVICVNAPKEGACVPCGHVVGCMNCLNCIKAKNWGCPVCRAEINQIIKLYTV